MKKLKQSLDDLWSSNIDNFARAVSDVGSYHVEAAEIFDAVPLYPGDNSLMKLYRWSIYDGNNTVLLIVISWKEVNYFVDSHMDQLH